MCGIMLCLSAVTWKRKSFTSWPAAPWAPSRSRPSPAVPLPQWYVHSHLHSVSSVLFSHLTLSTHSRSLALCRSCLRWSVAKRELLSMTPRTARRSLVQKWIHESRYLEHVPILESESSRSCCVVLRLICSVRRCEAGIEVGDGVLP